MLVPTSDGYFIDALNLEYYKTCHYDHHSQGNTLELQHLLSNILIDWPLYDEQSLKCTPEVVFFFYCLLLRNTHRKLNWTCASKTF